MPLIKIESYKSENYMIISSSEYNVIRNQLDRMYKISYALFDAYYGKDYYLPISASDADVYEYLAHELIKDLEKIIGKADLKDDKEEARRCIESE